MRRRHDEAVLDAGSTPAGSTISYKFKTGDYIKTNRGKGVPGRTGTVLRSFKQVDEEEYITFICSETGRFEGILDKDIITKLESLPRGSLVPEKPLLDLYTGNKEKIKQSVIKRKG